MRRPNEDAMTNLSGAFQGMTNLIGSSVLPMFTSWVNSLADGIVFVRTFATTLTGNWDQIKSGISDVHDSTLTLVTNFGGHVWEIMKSYASILWQPYIQAAQFAWDQIRFHVVAPVWNAIGRDVVTLVNKVIAQFNALSSYVGFTIDQIDFSRLTTDAPKTLAERWDEGVESVLRNIQRMVRSKYMVYSFHSFWAQLSGGALYALERKVSHGPTYPIYRRLPRRSLPLHRALPPIRHQPPHRLQVGATGPQA